MSDKDVRPPHVSPSLAMLSDARGPVGSTFPMDLPSEELGAHPTPDRLGMIAQAMQAE